MGFLFSSSIWESGIPEFASGGCMAVEIDLAGKIPQVVDS
jgi:hypothetical protein